MKRILSYIAVGLTAGAFILLCLIWILKINVLIPIAMFAAAFVLLGVVKRMHIQDELNALYPGDEKSDGEEGR